MHGPRNGESSLSLASCWFPFTALSSLWRSGKEVKGLPQYNPQRLGTGYGHVTGV